jgi:hypothetical protein
MPPDADAAAEYAGYLTRFTERLGPCEVGAYAASGPGRPIKKLSPDEFAVKLREFHDIDRAYTAIVQQGDTLNDMLVRLLRERAAELLIDRQLV